MFHCRLPETSGGLQTRWYHTPLLPLQLVSPLTAIHVATAHIVVSESCPTQWRTDVYQQKYSVWEKKTCSLWQAFCCTEIPIDYALVPHNHTHTDTPNRLIEAAFNTQRISNCHWICIIRTLCSLNWNARVYVVIGMITSVYGNNFDSTCKAVSAHHDEGWMNFLFQ